MYPQIFHVALEQCQAGCVAMASLGLAAMLPKRTMGPCALDCATRILASRTSLNLKELLSPADSQCTALAGAHVT